MESFYELGHREKRLGFGLMKGDQGGVYNVFKT